MSNEDEFRIGSRAWFVDKGNDEVLHGSVVAYGPDLLVVDVDGPWTNIVGGPRIVRRDVAKPGRAPTMKAESFNDYYCRCLAIVEHEKRVTKVQREAEALGLKVSR